MTVVQHPESASPVDESLAHSPQSRRQIPLRSTCARPHTCPRHMRMKILAQLSLFAGLTEDELDGIDQRMVSLSWAEGDRLYGAGDTAEHFYVVAAGQVKSFQSTRGGQDTIVDVLAPGDFFGAIGGGARPSTTQPSTGLPDAAQPVYAETVEALVTTCALRMDTDLFRQLLLEYPQIGLRVLDTLAASLASARSATSSHAAATVAQRVARTLVRLGDRFGQPGASSYGILIQLPLTRSDLADMTGSTPESVSRVMSKLRDDGVIDSGRRWTSILDRAALVAVAGAEG
ncbi:Crp/Fnr family transcriptional regulator [Cryobacterium sp. 1639]|nr:Crp/Fnr family transcriptional regulator [Cryobacterium sp. 1639]